MDLLYGPPDRLEELEAYAERSARQQILQLVKHPDILRGDI
jgi:hypothetical protein